FVPTRSGRWTCRCEAGWSTSLSPMKPRRCARPGSICPISRDRSAIGNARISACYGKPFPKTACAFTTCDRSSRPSDTESVLELRRHFGLTTLTAFIRIEGRTLGVVANNPMHLAGAIDSDGSDKAARFIKLCDAFDIPLLYLCDTPGI